MLLFCRVNVRRSALPLLLLQLLHFVNSRAAIGQNPGRFGESSDSSHFWGLTISHQVLFHKLRFNTWQHSYICQTTSFWPDWHRSTPPLAMLPHWSSMTWTRYGSQWEQPISFSVHASNWGTIDKRFQSVTSWYSFGKIISMSRAQMCALCTLVPMSAIIDCVGQHTIRMNFSLM